MSELLKNIEASEQKLAELEQLLKDKEDKFLKNDGVILKPEQKKLDDVQKKIDAAKDKVKAAKDEYLKYANEWKDRADDLTELKDQYMELVEWEHPAASDVKKDLQEINTFKKDKWFKKAVEALNTAQKNVEKPWAEIEKQQPFKLQFETNHSFTQKRYEKVQDSEFAAAKPVQDAISAVDDALVDAFKSVDAHNYEKALKELEKADAALDKVEDAIKQLQVEQDTYYLNRDVLNERHEKLRSHPWQSEIVKGAVSQIDHNLPSIDDAANIHDYDQANDLLVVAFGFLDDAEKDIAKNSPDDMPTKTVTLPDGTVLAFTDKEFEERKAEICKQLKNGPVRSLNLAAEILDDTWKHYQELNSDQWAVSWVIETIAWTELPPRAMVDNALKAASQVENAVNAKDIDAFLKMFPDAEKLVNESALKMKQYQADIESGGTIAITTLEFTKTASFTFCAVFAGPAVGAVAGTGVVASAVIGGAAVAATQSTATEIGHWSAGTPGWTPGQAVQNVLIDTSVGAITGLIAKGGSSKIAQSVTSKVAAKIAAREGFKRLSQSTLTKVAAFLLKEGGKQALEDAVKDVGAMLKGDPKMTMEVFVENLASNFLKGVALGSVGKVIDKYAEGAIEKLASSDMAKIEELALKETLNQLDPAVKKEFYDQVQERTEELAKKYVGDMIKKNGEKAVEYILPSYSGPFDPKAIDKAIRDYMFSSPEMKEAFNKTAAQIVKEFNEKAEAKKKEEEAEAV